MRYRLIAGTINWYKPERGWFNIHLDVSDRGIFKHGEGFVQPEYVADIANMPDVETEHYDEVRCHHVLEHLHRQRAPLAIREFHRVLKPGGVLDVQVPDMRWLARQLADEKIPDDGILTVMYGEDCAHWTDGDAQVHHWGFTEETLTALLVDNGFEVMERIPGDLRLIGARRDL